MNLLSDLMVNTKIGVDWPCCLGKKSLAYYISNEKGKDQESIQSNTTHDTHIQIDGLTDG